jgi:threonyl-tRNA synthetase
LKFEFNFVDKSDKASALSTDQIDIENGKRYDIQYTDQHGEQRHPFILHCSPSGAIERVIYALLEKQAIKMSKGEKAMLPLWLSPTQIRFIPISDDFVSDCELYVKALQDHTDLDFIRADVDDRDESVSRRIRDAEKEWIPITIVVGDKEKTAGRFKPRFRSADIGDDSRVYTVEELAQIIDSFGKGFPTEPLPLPLLLSNRPRFK